MNASNQTSTVTRNGVSQNKGIPKQSLGTRVNQTSSVSNGLTKSLESKLNAPASSPEFDLHTETNAVLKDIGLTTADAGGNLSFYGSDPILPSPMRFGTMAAVGLAARSVALTALWRQATGEGQDISVDVRKALRRFAGFFEGKWETRDSEVEAFAWDVQVGMRSTILDDAKEDREKFNQLLKDADVFFANKRPGFLKKHGLDAESLCEQKPGLIHAIVAMHGEKGPWSNRPGFDEIGAAVSGLFTIEGSPTRPKQPPIVPIADNVVGWLGTTGILAALRRRAIEGGSYRVVVSLTRTVLWLLSLGIFDKAYAKATAGSSDEHKYIAPDLFTAETPLGTYQGMTDQIVMSRTPGAFRTVLVPRGSSKPEWLPVRK